MAASPKVTSPKAGPVSSRERRPMPPERPAEPTAGSAMPPPLDLDGDGSSSSPRGETDADDPVRIERRMSAPADMLGSASSKSPLRKKAPPPPAQPFASFLGEQLGLHHDQRVEDSMSDQEGELRREGVYNFLTVPWMIEPMLVFGYVTCLDCFVNQFTFLPMRVVYSATKLLRGKRLTPMQSCELLRGFLIAFVSYLVLRIDMSLAYHSVRNQATIKLYVIFNMLEIFDKLCASFGQDILEALYASTLRKRRWCGGMACDFVIALVYVTVHTLVLFYHGVALTCAVNSNNNVLLTLLVSNNFVELKGNVFKKCEVPNLFQIACSDVVERFQLSIYLFFVLLQYVKEGGFGVASEGFQELARSLALISTAELVVDWVKHAFVIKFNHIHPAVYSRFTYILCSGMSPKLQKHAEQQPGKLSTECFHEGSGAVCARMGFVPIPLLCLVVRIVGHDVYPSLDMLHPSGWLLCLLIWLACCALKVLTSIALLGFACHRVEQRAKEEESANASDGGKLFLDGVERFSLYGKRIP